MTSDFTTIILLELAMVIVSLAITFTVAWIAGLLK